MEQRKAVFIINPISGGRSNLPVLEEIKKHLSPDIKPEIIHWDSLQKTEAILKRIKGNDFDTVVAVGGDGTINQVAQALVKSDKKLAIIPRGSGNGLARHLGIPLDVKAAIDVINKDKTKSIDSCFVNNIFFGCTSGIGFDALIGKLFAESKTRGFFTYFKLTMGQFVNYKAQDYKLYIDGDKEINTKAFFITFANANQFGNNAYVAPNADISDGLLDICILKSFPLWSVVGIGRRIFNKTVNRSPYMDTYRSKTIIVKREKKGPVHFDGEPAEMGEVLRYEVLPNSLNVIVP